MGRLRVLLIVVLVVSPVTADLRHGLSGSKASGQKGGIYPSGRGGQNYWAFPVCVPYLLSEYRFGQKYTSQYDFTGHLPPGCADYRCTSRGYCISEIRLNLPFTAGSRSGPWSLSPNGCLAIACTGVRWPR